VTINGAIVTGRYASIMVTVDVGDIVLGPGAIIQRGLLRWRRRRWLTPMPIKGRR
jgi:hypothetical protein